MKIVVVPHGPKLAIDRTKDYLAMVAADPPMTMEGKLKMLGLVPTLKDLGPYDAVYCSLMDRACGTMCTIVKQLGIKRVMCLDELGQYGNLDGDTVIAYPGHEGDNVLTWQKQGLAFLDFISLYQSLKKALVFTHRPVLAGLVASASCITDTEGIQKILDAKELVGRGFRVFSCTNSGLTLEI